MSSVELLREATAALLVLLTAERSTSVAAIKRELLMSGAIAVAASDRIMEMIARTTRSSMRVKARRPVRAQYGPT
jgi:hypothetical protein